MVGDLHWLIISPVSIQPCPTEMFCFLFSIYCLKPWQQEEGKHDCVTFTLCLVRSWPRFGGWRCSQAPPDLLLIPPNEIKRCGIPKYRPHLWWLGGATEGAHSSRAAGWCEPCPLISYHEVLCLSDVRQHQYCFHPTLGVWRRVGRLGGGDWNRLQTPPKIEPALESVWAKGPLKFFHSCLENECLMTPCWKRLWLVNWIRWKVLPKLPSNEVRLWTDDEEELLGKITLEDQVVRHNDEMSSHGPTVPHGRYVWWRRLSICCYSGEREEPEKLSRYTQ